jgi:hypothetical protein
MNRSARKRERERDRERKRKREKERGRGIERENHVTYGKYFGANLFTFNPLF